MDILSSAAIAAKYIVELIGGSKTFDKVKEESIGKTWKWVQQHVFKRIPTLEDQVKREDTKEAKEQVVTKELTTLLQQNDFKDDFLEWIKTLEQTPSLKNYFGTHITEIDGSIRVGDALTSGRNANDEKWDMKNIAAGKIDKMKGDFSVGDKEL